VEKAVDKFEKQCQVTLKVGTHFVPFGFAQLASAKVLKK
jgi:hypothetical protein